MNILLVFWAFLSFYQPLIRLAFVLFGLAFIFCEITQSTKKKGLKVINLFMKGVILIYILIALVSMSLIMTYKVKPIDSPNYILILGDAVIGETPSERLKLRLDEGVSEYEKYSENLNLKIVVSGGMGKDELISEAEVMQAYLISKGVPSQSILVEPNATSTKENLAFSKGLIATDWQENGMPKILIVSSWFHLYRVHLLAEYYDYDYGTQSANTPTSIVVQPIVREWFALVNDVSFVIKK